jgi:hypothetical protein
MLVPRTVPYPMVHELLTIDIRAFGMKQRPFIGDRYCTLNSVADPDPGSGIWCLFDPWTRIRDPE